MDNALDPLFASDRGRPTVQRIVDLAHRHLRLDMVLVSEIRGAEVVVRALAGDARSFGVTLGHTVPADTSYAMGLVRGHVPHLVADTEHDPLVAGMAHLRRADARALVGVPLRRSDGSLFGVLCGASHGPDPSLTERDVRFLAMLAELLAPLLDDWARTDQMRDALIALIENDGARVAYQPVVDLRRRKCLGVEALARFPDGIGGTEKTFAAANQVGLGLELERLMVRLAWPVLEQLHRLGETRFLAINLTPGALSALAPIATATRDVLPLGNLVVEMTENAVVDSYDRLRRELQPLRERGLRIGIDDAGAGYASFRHVVELHPEFIKIDRSLIHGVAVDRARQVTVRAFLGVASDLGATLVAEGVECPDDLAALEDLGVPAAQGYLLAPPSDDPGDLARWLRLPQLQAPPRRPG